MQGHAFDGLRLKQVAEALQVTPPMALRDLQLLSDEGKGAISFEDADSVVARIKKHFPDQVDVLIRTKEEPVKDALSNLSAADLKKIGVTVSEAGDKCVVKPVDSEVDKMVDALLKAAAREFEEA